MKGVRKLIPGPYDFNKVPLDEYGSVCHNKLFYNLTGQLPFKYVDACGSFKDMWEKKFSEGRIFKTSLIDFLKENEQFKVLESSEEIRPKDNKYPKNSYLFWDLKNEVLLNLSSNHMGVRHNSFKCLNENSFRDYLKEVEGFLLTEEEFKSHQKPKAFLLENDRHEGLIKSAFDLKKVEVDIEKNYNDDISFVEKKMKKFVNNKDSGNGLCLLHGDPSGGKTSYIRHLIQDNPTVPFIFIPPSMVDSFASPDFTSFLRDNKNSILIIEDAENILRKREDGQRSDCVANLLQLTDGLLSDAYRLKIIATFNTGLKNIDESLRRKGRLHVEYKFDKLSLQKSRDKAKELKIEQEINERMMLGEIYNLTTDNGVKEEEKREIGFN